MHTGRAGGVTLFLALSVFAPEASAAEDGALRLTWVDVDAVVPFAYSGVVAESREILASAGLEADWTHARAGDALPPGDVTVILLNRRPSEPGRAMGAVQPGSTRKVVWIYVPNVIWALDLSPSTSGWTAAQRRDFGVALGRVVVHEIVHLLAPDLPHASDGLMSSRLGRRELLRTRIAVDDVSRRALAPGLGALRRTAEASIARAGAGDGR